MADIRITTSTGEKAILKKSVVEEFRETLRGALILYGDDEYDASRTVHNAMIDRRPGLIVRCAGIADRPGRTRTHMGRIEP